MEKKFTIDGNKALTKSNFRFDGFGFISANSSSRLLLDYKQEHPAEYKRLLEYVFGENGLGISLFKLEMGSDTDSSSGTEPAVKRSFDEQADVTRGAGYQLAKDALMINPELKLDMLYWGIPGWVSSAGDRHQAMYQWFKETLEAAYDTYGLKFSYITANQNEREEDTEFIKYLRKHLDNEKNPRYDYSKISLVAGDEVGTWFIAQKLLCDPELMDAVDVIGSHYTSFTTPEVLRLQRDYGKKVWFSEGISPMSYSEATYRYDGTGSGLADVNGMLDVATRITTAMASSMTMYEFQPAVCSYYDGATYFQKHLILANSPWSGGFKLDTGFYMTLQFLKFIKPGWMFVDEARYGDGTCGGDGHAIVGSVYNYAACLDDEKKNCSVFFVNATDKPITYSITLKNLSLSSDVFYIWETFGPKEGEPFFKNFFRKTGYTLCTDDRLCVTVKPYSMMTLSTLDVERQVYKDSVCTPLSLPYEDDFNYASYPSDYLASRGYAPRYTNDLGGAFEVEKADDGNMLVQKITPEIIPVSWAAMTDPITHLGDDTWSNYTASIDVHFPSSPKNSHNYVGLGVRYNMADCDYSGYRIMLHDDGHAELMKENETLLSTFIKDLDTSKWHSLSITVVNNNIKAGIDGVFLFSYTDSLFPVNSGRAALYCSFDKNCFRNLKITPQNGVRDIITRADNLDELIAYSEGSCVDKGEGWFHNTMCDFKNYRRTLSKGYAGAYFSFKFKGTAFSLIGSADEAVISVSIDKDEVEKALKLNGTAFRKAVYYNYTLDDSEHDVTVTVLSGSLSLDAVEYC